MNSTPPTRQTQAILEDSFAAALAALEAARPRGAAPGAIEAAAGARLEVAAPPDLARRIPSLTIDSDPPPAPAPHLPPLPPIARDSGIEAARLRLLEAIEVWRRSEAGSGRTAPAAPVPAPLAPAGAPPAPPPGRPEAGAILTIDREAKSFAREALLAPRSSFLLDIRGEDILLNGEPLRYGDGKGRSLPVRLTNQVGRLLVMLALGARPSGKDASAPVLSRLNQALEGKGIEVYSKPARLSRTIEASPALREAAERSGLVPKRAPGPSRKPLT
jgi:hypothetical protein